MRKYLLIILGLVFLNVAPLSAQLEGGFQDADETNKFRAIDFNRQFVSDVIEFEGKLLVLGKGAIYTYNPSDESIKILVEEITMDAGEVSSGEFVGIYSMMVNEKLFDIVIYNLFGKNREALGTGYALLNDPVHRSLQNKGEILEFIPQGQGYYVEKINQKTVLSTGGIGESSYSEVQEIFSFRKFRHGTISTNVLFFVDYKTSDLKTSILYKIATGEDPTNASGITELFSHDLSIFNDAAVYVSAAKDLTTATGEKGETVKVIEVGLGMKNLFTFGDDFFCSFIPGDQQIYIYDSKLELIRKVSGLGPEGKFLTNGLNNVLNLTPNLVALETENLGVLLFDSELNQLNENNIITSEFPLLNIKLVDKLAFLSTRSLTDPFKEEVNVVDISNGETQLEFKLEVPIAGYTVHNTFAKTNNGIYHAAANKENGFEVFIKNEKGFQVAEEIFNTDYEQAVLEQLKITEVLPEYSTYPKRILNFNGTLYSLSHLQMPDSFTNADAQDAGFSTPVRDMNFLYKLNQVPAAPSPSTFSIDENAAVGSAIGLVSSSDADDSNLSFQLATGTGSADNGKVTLNSNQLLVNDIPDYESDSLWNIRVRTTDPHGDSRSREITININDLNEAPAGLILSTDSVSENVAAGEPIAGIETLDEDLGDSFTYSLVASTTDPGVADADNEDFTISDSILVSNTTFDALVKNEYFVTLEVSDQGGETYQQAFVITIVEENRVPSDILLDNNTVQENLSGRTLVGTFNTEDLNTGQDNDDTDDIDFTYALVSGSGDDNNSDFEISADSLYAISSFNFEVDAALSVLIQTTDPDTATFSKVFTINIEDVNDAPTGLSLTTEYVSENLSTGEEVAGIEAIDEDETDTFTYSLVSSTTDPGVADADNGDFTISDSILVSNTTFDALVKDEYFITLEVGDEGGETYQQAFVINITEVNEAPTDILLNNNNIEENLLGRTLIGTFNTEDLNTGQDNDDTDDIDFTYALVSGSGDDDNSDFEISADSLYAISPFNFEEDAALSILVQTTDPETATYSKVFTINVEDVNDAPTGLSLSTEYVSENLSTGEEVAGIETIDEDETDTFIYSLVSSPTDPGVADADNDAFSISGSTLVSNTSFDRATKAEYFITLRVSDKGDESYQEAFVINITEVNEVPTDIILDNSTVEENLTDRTLVGTLDTEDGDTGEDNDDTDDVDFTYALVVGTGDDNNSDFEISADSLYAISSFDFEENASLSVRIQTTDPKNATFKKTFTITVTDANDPPSSMLLSNDSIDENQSAGVVIGILDGQDPDASDEFSFALIDEANFPDNNAFSVNSSNELVQDIENFDYESQSLYEIKLQLTDKGDETVDSVFIVHIRDTNDQPSDITLSGNSVVEETANAVAGSLGVVDQDANDAHDFSIPSDTLSNNLFQILTGNELALSAPLNYEADDLVYEVYLEVTDLAGTVFGKVLEIDLIDINDPVDTLVIKRTTVRGGLAFEEKVSNIELRDEDLGDNISNFYSRDDYALSLANVGEFPDNSNFQIYYLTNDQVYALRAATDLTYTDGADNNYHINIEAVNEGLSYSQSFEISLVSESTNTPPTQINISNDSVLSVATVGTEIGVLSSVDDAGDTHTYSLVTNTSDNDNELFSISADRLILQANLKDSARMSYTVVVNSEDNGGLTLQEEISIYVKEYVDSTPPEITGVIGGDFSVDESQSTFELSGSVTDDAVIESVELEFGPVTNVEFTKNDIIELEGNQFTGSIPSDQGDAFGLKVRVVAVDTSGNTAASDTVYFYRSVSSSGSLANLPTEQIGTGKRSIDYRMFSVPYEIQSENRSIRDIFETSLGQTYSEGNFKIYRWNTEAESYDEFLSIGTVESGESYWLSTIIEEPSVNFGNGNVFPYKTDNKASWNFKAGWNQVGNPYPLSIDWEVIQTNNPEVGDLYVFGEQGFTRATSLAPHQGAFVLVQENMSVDADVNSNSAARIGAEADRSESSLELALNLTQGELQAEGGVAMHDNAKDGLDSRDQANPPALGEHVEISFNQPESVWHNYRWDVVKAKDYHVWSFTVNTTKKDQFNNLSWNAKEFLKGQFYLVDMETLQKIDLTERSEYQFRGKNTYQFKLVYDRYATDRFDLGELLIGAPYPNPFSATVSIPVNISDKQNAQASIQIMDINGRLLAEKSWTSELITGYQLLKFDQSNINTRNGNSLSTGIYIYKLKVTESNGTEQKTGRIIKH